MERVSESTRTGWRTALETASRWERAPGPEDAQLIQNLVQAYALFADAGRPEDAGGAVHRGRRVGRR